MGPVQVDENIPDVIQRKSSESDIEESGMTNGGCSCVKEVENGVHPLYHNCSCQWPGCATMLNTVPLFLDHLRSHHGLDDRSTAQCRVQTQVVTYLEEQLKAERDRLSAMMTHLHSLPSKSSPKPKDEPKTKYDSDDSLEQRNHSPRVLPSTSLSLHMLLAGASEQYPDSPPSPLKATPETELTSEELTNEINRKISENELTRKIVCENELTRKLAENELTKKLAENELSRKLCSEVKLNFPSPLPNLHYNGNYENMMAKMLPSLQYKLPSPENNLMECKLRTNSAPTPGTILANAALYQNPNVKPPFTYASLIREAIISSPNKRMSLNEVYNWFSHTFSFFRFNNSQWKNAVRHNLSLHKCFQRVEGPVGSGWTVNEDEFQLRRANRVNAIRSGGEEDSPSPNNYILSLQEHMNKIQEQMLSSSELSDEFLQNQRSPKQERELVNDTPRYWSKIGEPMSGVDLKDVAEMMRGKELKMKEEYLEQS